MSIDVLLPAALAFIMFSVVLALLAAGMASGGLRALIDEVADKIGPLAVAATLPAQIAAILLCSAALWVLRPGVGFWGCLNSRLLRDAGDNLLVFLPGLGEVIGARALVLSGGRTRAAVTASALDKFAETAAQVPYIVLAAFIPQQSWVNYASLAFGVTTLHDPSNDTATIYTQSEMQRAGLVFVGALHPDTPNEDGLLWFVEQVIP